jgi:F-type H+-transporting ATPase subunit epsilon
MAGHMALVSALRAGMIETRNDGVETKYFIRGGLAEINATQVTVLAEEAIPMTEMDLAVLDQRIKDAQDDEIAAKTDDDRLKAAQMVDDLKLVRAAF